MADAFIHLTSCEQLSQDSRLYPEIATLMAKHMPAAKLGAIFVDLPHYQGLYTSAVRHWLGMPYRLRRWVEVFHRHKPTGLGFAFAELAKTDMEFVNRDWSMAFVAGYFSHLAFDRVIHALINRLVYEHLQPGEDPRTLHFEIEKLQGLLFHRELFGEDVLGSKRIGDMTAAALVQKENGDAEILQFIERGCLKGLGMAPSAREVKAWARGFGRYAGLLQTPIAKAYNPPDTDEARHLEQLFYRNDFFHYVTFYNRAMAIAVDYINAVYAYCHNLDFSDLARDELSDIIPEMDIANPPDEDIPASAPKFDERIADSVVVPLFDPRKYE